MFYSQEGSTGSGSSGCGTTNQGGVSGGRHKSPVSTRQIGPAGDMDEDLPNPNTSETEEFLASNIHITSTDDEGVGSLFIAIKSDVLRSNCSLGYGRAVHPL